MKFDKLSRDDLKALLASPAAIRKYCLDNGLQMFDLIEKINEKLEARKTKKKVSLPVIATGENYIPPAAVRTPDGMVTTVLRDLQAERFTGHEYTLQDLVARIEAGMTHNEIPYDLPCPIEGFVAQQLYENVRAKMPNSDRLVNLTPVGIVDVRRRLRIDLNRVSKEHIIGNVGPDYLKKHYVFEGGELRYQDATGKTHPNTTLEGTVSWDSKHKDEVRKKLAEFAVQNLGKRSPHPVKERISYLGLEGPRYGSFIPIATAFKQEGIAVQGTLVEYDSRSFRLMQSVQKAGLCGLVDDTQAIFGDIDDQIILDFVKDPSVSLVRRDNREGSSSLQVKYAPPRRKHAEYLPIDQYDSLLNDLGKGSSSKKLAKEYGVSESFIETVQDRHEGRFDLVYLDYVGRITPKRKLAIESLIKRRLADRAVVSATVNVAHRITPMSDQGPVASIPQVFFERVMECLDRGGYEGREMFDDNYRESNQTDGMCFQAYYIERKQKT